VETTLNATDLGFVPAPGFRAAATACGLKASGAPDLALIAAAGDVAAAGTFTTNRVQAAPVIWDRRVLEQGAGRVRAVIANSGCANACTGEPGLADTRATAALTAQALGCEPEQILVLSTGVIGTRLPLDLIEAGIVALGPTLAATDDALEAAAVARLGAPDAGGDAARAIMTTDTRPKLASAACPIGGRVVRIEGIAKGAGMIHPHMATMLSVLTTDVRAEPAVLQSALAAAVRRSFNRISVDGDMSTNDTVLLLASGASGAALTRDVLPAFGAALEQACVSLARQIARDGEGATRLIEIEVRGAATEEEAHAIADRIANSPLVKTAVHGGDPNWGRILAAAGTAGVAFDPDRVTLTLGAGPGAVRVVEGGLPARYEEPQAAATMREDPVRMTLDLDRGPAAATVWTCDFSAEYVAINAHYTT